MAFLPIEANPPLRRQHSISEEKFVAVLRQLKSPAAAEAAALALVPGRYGLDRGVALAFFVHESSAGKAGICQDYDTRNWGNLRRVQRPERGVVISTRGGQFAKYHSWTAGLEDWCELLTETYEKRWKLTTLGEVLRRYAPKEDRNDPVAYASKVVSYVRRWQAEERKFPIGTRPPWWVVVTAADGLNIREGRGVEFPVAGVLKAGERVLVDDDTAGWLHLRDERGFVSGRYTQAD